MTDRADSGDQNHTIFIRGKDQKYLRVVGYHLYSNFLSVIGRHFYRVFTFSYLNPITFGLFHTFRRDSPCQCKYNHDSMTSIECIHSQNSRSKEEVKMMVEILIVTHSCHRQCKNPPPQNFSKLINWIEFVMEIQMRVNLIGAKDKTEGDRTSNRG